jgi:hypothetical protein
VRVAGLEPGVITSGDGLAAIRTMLIDDDDYSAADVVTHLLGDLRGASAISDGPHRELRKHGSQLEAHARSV